MNIFSIIFYIHIHHDKVVAQAHAEFGADIVTGLSHSKYNNSFSGKQNYENNVYSSYETTSSSDTFVIGDARGEWATEMGRRTSGSKSRTPSEITQT